MKKFAVAMTAIMLLTGMVSAQDDVAEKKNMRPWIEINWGIGFLDGSTGFADHMQTYHPELDYKDSYKLGSQLGIAIGFDYRQFSLSIHLAGMNSNAVFVKNQLVKKEDMLTSLDFGYRFAIGKGFSLEPTIGFGLSVSEIFISTSRGGTDYVNSFTTGNLAVPLTMSLWFDKKHLGVYLQYILSVGQLNKARITGLETEVDDLNFTPGTLTLGWKYRF